MNLLAHGISSGGLAGLEGSTVRFYCDDVANVEAEESLLQKPDELNGIFWLSAEIISMLIPRT